MIESALNALRDRVHAIAERNGWHEETWSRRHLICLVVSELMEAVNADRSGRMAQTEVFRSHINTVVSSIADRRQREEAWKMAFEDCIKDTVEDELADGVIRLLDYFGETGYDLSFVFNWDDECVSRKFPADAPFTEHIYTLCSLLFADCCDILAFRMLVAFARLSGIDIWWHVEQKMRYNEMRGYRHGGKRY